MYNISRNNKGAIALTSMIVLGSIIILMITSLVLLGLSSRLSAFALMQSEEAFVKTGGCLEEALIQLNRDPVLYTGDSYNVDGLGCTAVVSGIPVDTVTVDSSLGDFHQHFTVGILITPILRIMDFEY